MILKMKKEKTKPKEENILEENSSDNKNDIVENEEKSTIDEQILEREMRKFNLSNGKMKFKLQKE